ncbi:MAG TPA: hypothetical protein VMS23_03100, partial [Terrimicrobiaceae bacterium]|nr:hypothetical protein [Terrimicrobiaceae bacterium]
QKQSAAAPRFVLLVACPQVGLDVAVVKENFPSFETGEGALQIYQPGPDGFYLGAFELNACFEGVQDVVVPERLAVGYDFCGHVRRRRLLRLGVLAIADLGKNQLTLGDLRQGDIRKAHATFDGNHRAAARTELADTLRYHVY